MAPKVVRTYLTLLSILLFAFGNMSSILSKSFLFQLSLRHTSKHILYHLNCDSLSWNSRDQWKWDFTLCKNINIALFAKDVSIIPIFVLIISLTQITRFHSIRLLAQLYVISLSSLSCCLFLVKYHKRMFPILSDLDSFIIKFICFSGLSKPLTFGRYLHKVANRVTMSGIIFVPLTIDKAIFSNSLWIMADWRVLYVQIGQYL